MSPGEFAEAVKFPCAQINFGSEPDGAAMLSFVADSAHLQSA